MLNSACALYFDMSQFEEEVNGILESALADNDVLFGVYLSTALILFYGFLFRTTLCKRPAYTYILRSDMVRSDLVFFFFLPGGNGWLAL